MNKSRDEGDAKSPEFKRFERAVKKTLSVSKSELEAMREAFALAEKQVPSIVVRRGLMGGNPCIKGTRIPVYMILDGIEYYGNLKGVLKSYPQLTIKQVRDAVRFSKIAMECSA